MVSGKINRTLKHCCATLNMFIKLTVTLYLNNKLWGIVAFPLQQWLPERATMLRCKYSACLVIWETEA